jgi:hypothetical protein
VYGGVGGTCQGFTIPPGLPANAIGFTCMGATGGDGGAGGDPNGDPAGKPGEGGSAGLSGNPGSLGTTETVDGGPNGMGGEITYTYASGNGGAAGATAAGGPGGTGGQAGTPARTANGLSGNASAVGTAPGVGPSGNSHGCRVPKLVGKALPAARRALHKAGCKLGKVSRHPSTKVRPGKVISSSPHAGKTARRPVKITISSGKPNGKGRRKHH